MDYTNSPNHAIHSGTNNPMHQADQAVATDVSANDLNQVRWSLMEVLKAGKQPAIAFDPDNPASYTGLLKAIKTIIAESAISGVLVGGGGGGTSPVIVDNSFITNPTSGEQLSGTSHLVTWQTSAAVEAFTVVATPDANNLVVEYFKSGELDSNVRSITVTDLPQDGTPVDIVLNYKLAGIWYKKVVSAITENTSGTPRPLPSLVSPTASDQYVNGAISCSWSGGDYDFVKVTAGYGNGGETSFLQEHDVTGTGITLTGLPTGAVTASGYGNTVSVILAFSAYKNNVQVGNFKALRIYSDR